MATIVIFDAVELDEGPRKLRVVVDANLQVDEPNEVNNAVELDVTCASEN